MTLEAPRVPEDGFGSLQSCLVEGDPQSEKRARLIKRRAVAISIALQTLALTALVLYPLLSRGERISFKYATPIPPYSRSPIGDHQPTPTRDGHTPTACHICPSRSIPGRIVMRDPTPPGEPNEPIVGQIPGAPSPDGVIGSYNPSASRPVPPPQQNITVRTERRPVSEPLQMAKLINRVDPAYPTLAKQLHREGRVELHAVISTDGRVESLEVISGDPLFIQSALSAVREWRYRPTILNGNPIEVDTHITVIYTLSY
jgi:periplasmic protein TonB